MCRLKSFLQNYKKEIVSMSSASVNTRFPRMAGVLIISSTLVALIYRFFIVTALLGDVNSRAVLSGYHRGMLILGFVFAVIIGTAGLGALFAFLRGTSPYLPSLQSTACIVAA